MPAIAFPHFGQKRSPGWTAALQEAHDGPGCRVELFEGWESERSGERENEPSASMEDPCVERGRAFSVPLYRSNQTLSKWIGTQKCALIVRRQQSDVVEWVLCLINAIIDCVPLDAAKHNLPAARKSARNPKGQLAYPAPTTMGQIRADPMLHSGLAPDRQGAVAGRFAMPPGSPLRIPEVSPRNRIPCYAITFRLSLCRSRTRVV